jgi:hypothetical protein
MKLMVCGSRNVTNKEKIFKTLDDLSIEKITYLIHGCARGVDSIAGEWANKRGIPILEYPAQWEKYGKIAGFKRNTDMIKECDICVAFWDGQSKGTLDSIDKAKKFGKPVEIVRCNAWEP